MPRDVLLGLNPVNMRRESAYTNFRRLYGIRPNQANDLTYYQLTLSSKCCAIIKISQAGLLAENRLWIKPLFTPFQEISLLEKLESGLGLLFEL